MSLTDTERQNPYQAFAGTPEWSVIDQAIQELAHNNDLEEKTAHPYIVGYLCRALARQRVTIAQQPKSGIDEMQELVNALQQEFEAKNPGSDPLREFLAERRAEVEHE